MDSLLKGLFGGDSGQQQQASDFVNRFEQGPIDQGYTDDEAYRHFQNVAQNADPRTLQNAAEQTFARMDPNQRAQFSQMLAQRMGNQGMVSNDPRQMAGMVSQLHQQQPGGLASLFGGGNGNGGSGNGGGGFPGGTLGKVAMGGIAAYAMKEILGGGGGLLGGGDNGHHKRSV